MILVQRKLKQRPIPEIAVVLSRSIEVPLGIERYSNRLVSIASTRKAVKDGLIIRGIQFVHGSAIEATSSKRRSIEIALRVTNQISLPRACAVWVPFKRMQHRETAG